jgi:hypothetical protein
VSEEKREWMKRRKNKKEGKERLKVRKEKR